MTNHAVSSTPRKWRIAGVVATPLLALSPLLVVSSAGASAGTSCTSKTVNVAISFQPDQVKARATCSSLAKVDKFKAVLTSRIFPDANSSWRTTKGSVDTGSRPKNPSVGHSYVVAPR